VKVRKASRIEFDFRTLRRTYGQSLLNRGVALPSVSLMLGHNSTLTTEKYYCRQDADSARLEVVRAFEDLVARPVRANLKIDTKNRANWLCLVVDSVGFEPTKMTGSTRKGTRAPVYRVFGRQPKNRLKPISFFSPITRRSPGLRSSCPSNAVGLHASLFNRFE
jgi:hypothetical protein